MGRKMGFVLIFTILGLLTGLFSFSLFRTIDGHHRSSQYNDLIYETLTFEKYEFIDDEEGNTLYEIYFEEFDEPFEVLRATKKYFDRKTLIELKKETKVNVCYRESTSKNYTYVICEMKLNAVEILSLSDYKKVIQESEIILFFSSMTMVLVCSSLIGVMIFFASKSSDTMGITKDENNPNLGEIRIEYQSDGNVIRIFNSFTICSLVINDKIVAQCRSLVIDPFSLKGEVEVGGKKILVEAKMGKAYMRLYYDGKLVKMIFMGLG